MRRIPWMALSALLVGFGLRLAALLQPVSDLLPGCAFKRLTGLACATCGLTRCAMALGALDWRSALHWHPVAAVMVMLLPLAVAWDLRRAWRNEPYPRLPDSGTARASIWALLVVAWVLQVIRGI